MSFDVAACVSTVEHFHKNPELKNPTTAPPTPSHSKCPETVSFVEVPCQK